MRSRGHSITEYATIGFLVVLIAIPGLMGLGGRVDALLSGNGQALSDAEGLFSLIGGGPSGEGAGMSGASVAGDSGTVAAMQNAAEVLRSSDSDYASMGMITTSVSGQQELAETAAKSGTSVIAADRLKQFTESVLNLEANGKITPE